MRILVISDQPDFQDFFLNEALMQAGIDAQIYAAPNLIRAYNTVTAPDVKLAVIDVSTSLAFAEKQISHLRRASPETPIFVYFRIGADPSPFVDRIDLEKHFKNIGASGFADKKTDNVHIPSRLIKALGEEPPIQYLQPSTAIVPIGDVHVDLIKKRAYLVTSYDGTPDNLFSEQPKIGNPGISAQQKAFADARGPKAKTLLAEAIRMGRTNEFYERCDFADLSDEQCALIAVLQTQRDHPQKIDEIAKKITTGIFKPDRHDIVQAMQSLEHTLTALDQNAGTHLKGNPLMGYMISELSVATAPEITDSSQKTLSTATRDLFHPHDVCDHLPSEDPPPPEDFPEPGVFNKNPSPKRTYARDPKPKKKSAGPSLKKISGQQFWIGNNLYINTLTRQMSRFDTAETVTLTEEESSALNALNRANKPLSNVALLKAMYTSRWLPDRNKATQFIQSINRKVLGLGFSGDLILTKRGVGSVLSLDINLSTGPDTDPSSHLG